jgi:uncharacterized protein YndB with AHSA1/START domain
MTAADSGRLSVTAQSDREIVMTRIFDAPRRLVFEAWTKPELFVRWFGPQGWSVPVCEIDLRPSGSYRYVLRGPDGAEIGLRGVYREVVPPERLVCTQVFDGFSEVGWRPEDEAVITAVLTEQQGKTTWTAKVLYPSQEVRDAVFQLDAAWKGMGGSLDRLAEVLATLA